MQVREKVANSRNTLFSNDLGGWGSKSRLPRAAGAEPFGQLRQENVRDCEADLSQRHLMPGARLEAELFKKVHGGVVVRRTRRTQNPHKHFSFGALLEVELLRMCATPVALSTC